MKRHLAIGDIHGCINALTSLIDFVGLQPDDKIVTLGDYVDRGPNSRAVLDYIIALGKSHDLVPLRGNHEIMMLDSRTKESWFRAWLSYGGEATLRSYSSSDSQAGSFGDVPDEHIEFLENALSPYYECESHFFVHANADAEVELADQTDSALYWRKYDSPERHFSDKIMVCGHTTQTSGIPRSNGNAVCIDTWAYGTGWLSCLDVTTGTIWQANEIGDTRRFSLSDIENN